MMKRFLSFLCILMITCMCFTMAVYGNSADTNADDYTRTLPRLTIPENGSSALPVTPTDYQTDPISFTPPTTPTVPTPDLAPAAVITVPKATKLVKVSSKAKKLKVQWKKVKGVTGYQLQYSTSSKFTKKTTKTVTVKGAAKVSKTVKKLKKGKKYYVRIRTYKQSAGGKAVSAWSKVKKIKIK